MALSVGVGLGVLRELMAAAVDEVVGPKGRHNSKPTAKRHAPSGAQPRRRRFAARAMRSGRSPTSGARSPRLWRSSRSKARA